MRHLGSQPDSLGPPGSDREDLPQVFFVGLVSAVTGVESQLIGELIDSTN